MDSTHPPTEHVELEDIVLAVAVPSLPPSALQWPVKAMLATEEMVAPSPRVVLCGALDAVQSLLPHFDWTLLYIVTESHEPVVGGRWRNVCEPSLSAAEIDWESVVAAVCSNHLTSIPYQILRVGRSCPDRVAVSDGTASWTYAELVSAAWHVGEVIAAAATRRAPAVEGAVGVMLDPSCQTLACYLGLAMRARLACVLSEFEKVRTAQLERLACDAVLSNAELPEARDGRVSGVPVIRADRLALDHSTPLAHIVLAPSNASMLDAGLFVEWTSGSTGHPKGVVVSGWKLAHWVRWRQYHFPASGAGRAALGSFWAWYWHLPPSSPSRARSTSTCAGSAATWRSSASTSLRTSRPASWR